MPCDPTETGATCMNGSSSSVRSLPSSLTHSELLKTPPKRMTARKHTGRLTPNATSSPSRAGVTRANGAAATSPPAKKQKTVVEEKEKEKEAESCDVGESSRCGDSGEMRGGEEEEVGERVEGCGEGRQVDSEPVSGRVGGEGEEEKKDHLAEEPSREERGVEEMEMEGEEDERGGGGESEGGGGDGEREGGEQNEREGRGERKEGEEEGTPQAKDKSKPATPKSGRKKVAIHPFFSKCGICEKGVHMFCCCYYCCCCCVLCVL